MFNRRCQAWLALVIFASASTIRADTQPTDDPLDPTVETTDGVKFAVPARLRPEVLYRLQTTFESDREQSLTLYIWAQDDAQAGHWELRASYNNYFNGRTVTADLPLAPGRIYLLAAHYKTARAPGFGQPWHQSKLATKPESPQQADEAPAVVARFTGTRGVGQNASLTPIESPSNPPETGGQ